MLTIPAPDVAPEVVPAPEPAAPPTEAAPAESTEATPARRKRGGPIEVLMLPGKNGVPEIVRRRKREAGEV